MPFLLRFCLGLLLLAPALVHAAVLENPSGGNFYSGVGVVSGWKCDAEGALTVRFYDTAMTPVWAPIPLAYRNERSDTAGVCGDTNNGFVAIWNWANLGDGTYTAVVDDNGVEFGRSTFTVTTLGEAFITGARGECTIDDFPSSGESARFAWNQATQGLVLVPEPFYFPLRALHAGSKDFANRAVVERWEAGGRTGALVPPEYIAWLNSLHVNWIGLVLSLYYDDSMDSTIERVTSPEFDIGYSDDVLRQLIREFHRHGINVYLTLNIHDDEAAASARPAYRYDLGDMGLPETGVPGGLEGVLSPEFWPWRPDHPDHQRFVAEFWETYTQQAVHYARIAEAEGVQLYSLGTETDSLFRTRSGGEYWINDFGQELKSMVARVRAVYSGRLTYDMHASAFTNDFYGPGSNHLWEDLDLDIVGISAWFPLTDSRPSTVLSVAALQASYEQIFQDYLTPLAERNPGRPIVFLEYGAIEAVRAPEDPGNGSLREQSLVFTDTNGNGLDDAQETQANIYQALFNTMARHPGVVNGAFFWDNWIASEMEADYFAIERGGRGFAIRGKPAEEVVRSAYEGYKNQ